MTMEIERIGPEDARARIALSNALLVCSYDDRVKCRENYLEGAIDLSGLESMASRLPLSQEIIFYCA